MYYECAGKCEGVTSACPRTFVDCTMYGGYDPNDKCRQTCLKKEIAFDKDSCATRCKTAGEKMKFRTEADKGKYYDQCVSKCSTVVEKPVMARTTQAVTLVAYKSAADVVQEPVKSIAIVAATKCPKNYVNCTKYGGYDPKDVCKQTCLKTADAAQI